MTGALTGMASTFGGLLKNSLMRGAKDQVVNVLKKQYDNSEQFSFKKFALKHAMDSLDSIMPSSGQDPLDQTT